MSRRKLVTLLSAVAAVGLASALLLLVIVPSPPLRVGDYPDEEFNPELRSRQSDSSPAVRTLDSLKTERERQELVLEVARRSGAHWNDPLLRRAIVADPSEAVQLTALEESLRLAREAGGAAPTHVVRAGIASTKGNTRAAALKAAREQADPTFASELIQLVDENDPYAAMALNALAYTSATEASAKITEVASNANAERTLRERAIVLLAVTKDPEARQLLLDLSSGSDQSLARLAHEVLKAFD